jgi:hypothetical protein
MLRARGEATGGVRIVDNGTVCGVQVGGDEVLKKSWGASTAIFALINEQSRRIIRATGGGQPCA